MNSENTALLEKQKTILSFRDLSEGTTETYINYLSQFLTWVENEPENLVADVSWEEIRSYVDWLRNVRHIGNRTINVHCETDVLPWAQHGHSGGPRTATFTKIFPGFITNIY